MLLLPPLFRFNQQSIFYCMLSSKFYFLFFLPDIFEVRSKVLFSHLLMFSSANITLNPRYTTFCARQQANKLYTKTAKTCFCECFILHRISAHTSNNFSVLHHLIWILIAKCHIKAFYIKDWVYLNLRSKSFFGRLTLFQKFEKIELIFYLVGM